MLEPPNYEPLRGAYPQLSDLFDQFDAFVADVTAKLAVADAAVAEREAAERARADAEAAATDALSKQEALQSSIERLTQRSDELAAALSKSQLRAQELEEALSKKFDEDQSSTVTRTAQDSLHVDTARLFHDSQERIEHLTSELDRLQTTIRTQYSDIARLHGELGNAKAEAATARFSVQRLEQESALQKQQCDWLTTELQNKTDEFAAFRSEKSAALGRAQETAERLTAEQASLEEGRTRALAAAATANEQLQNALSSLERERTERITAEEHFKVEMDAQIRVANLYKDASEETKAAYAELEEALHRLQEEADNDRAQAAAAAAEAEQAIASVKEEIVEKEKIIAQLRDELEHANKLLESTMAPTPMTPSTPSSSKSSVGAPVDMLSATAAALSQLRNRDMSISQLYAGYLRLTDDNARLRSDNAGLQQTLEQVMSELEETAPMIKAKSEALDVVSSENSALLKQLHDARQTQTLQEARIKELSTESSRAERDLRMLQQHARDLSRQVQKLLGVSSDEIIVSDWTGSASEVIDANLVTFNNVSELQQRNAQLLLVVRELSEKTEAAERANEDSAIDAVRRELADAVSQVETLRETRKKQQAILDTIAQQRDAYKAALGDRAYAALARAAEKGQDGPSDRPIAPGDDDRQQQLDTIKKQLETISADYAAFRRERAEYNDAQEATIEKLRASAFDSRLAASTAEAQANLLRERLASVEQLLVLERRELETVRARSIEQQTRLGAYERQSDSLASSLQSARDELARVTSRSNHLSAQIEFFKSSEARITEELAQVNRERSSAAELARELQASQNALLLEMSEARARFESQAANLNKELEASRSELIETKSRASAAAARALHEASESQARSERDTAEIARLREQIARLTATNEQLERSLSDAESRLRLAEERLSVYIGTDRDAELRKLQDAAKVATLREAEAQARVAELDAREANTQDELRRLQDRVTQFADIAQAAEDAARQGAETAAQIQASLTSEIEALSASKKELVEAHEALAARLNDTLADLALAHQATDAAKTEARLAKEEAERQVREADIARDALANAEEARRADTGRLIAAAEEADARYRSQIMVHARDVELLGKSKERERQLDALLRTAQTDAEAAKASLRALEREREAETTRLHKQVEDLDRRCRELVEQNNILHNSLETIAEARRKVMTGGAGAAQGGLNSAQICCILFDLLTLFGAKMMRCPRLSSLCAARRSFCKRSLTLRVKNALVSRRVLMLPTVRQILFARRLPSCRPLRLRRRRPRRRPPLSMPRCSASFPKCIFCAKAMILCDLMFRVSAHASRSLKRRWRLAMPLSHRSRM